MVRLLLTIWYQVFMQCIGTLMRIFTTIQEVKDPLILSSFIAAFSLNAIIGSQMVSILSVSDGTRVDLF